MISPHLHSANSLVKDLLLHWWGHGGDAKDKVVLVDSIDNIVDVRCVFMLSKLSKYVRCVDNIL